MPKNPKPKPVIHFGNNFVIVKSKPKSRKGAKQNLQRLNSHDPDYAAPFDNEADLAEHIIDRIDATSMKKQHLIAQLYAEQKREVSIQIGGAIIQDRSGSSSHRDLNGKTVYSGREAAHVAIGTYSINGKISSREGMEFLSAQAQSIAGSIQKYPAFSSLVADGIFLDAFTQMVPTFINRSSGVIETQCIHFMKGLIPVFIPDNLQQLETVLTAERIRVVKLFMEKRKVLQHPIEQRLLKISQGKNKEFTQDPNDRQNLIFEGRETVFLQQLLALLNDASSELHSQVEQQIINHAAFDAVLIAQKAEAARLEFFGNA